MKKLRRLIGRRSFRVEEGSLVIEGPRLIVDALRFGVEITAVYVDGDVPPELDAALDAATPRFRLPEGGLDRVGDAVTSQGALAVGTWMPSPISALPSADDGGCLVLAVDIADPGNLGTMIRAADAAGIAAIVVSGGVDPTSPKVVRSSAGSLFGPPVLVADIDETLAACDRLGWRTAAAVAHDGESPERSDLGDGVALVMGNETHGLPSDVVERCASAVTITLDGRAESLNVAMATTVLAFEARRQRS